MNGVTRGRRRLSRGGAPDEKRFPNGRVFQVQRPLALFILGEPLEVVFAVEADDMDFVRNFDARRNDALRIRSDAEQELAAILGNQRYRNILEGLEGPFLAVVHIHQLSQVQHVEGPVALAVRERLSSADGRKLGERDGPRRYYPSPEPGIATVRCRG